MNHRNEPGTTSAASGNRAAGYFSPRVDILESEHELTLYADLPGVAADQLEIRYNEGQLALHGKVAPRQSQTPFVRKEYEVGDFYRVFTVGELIDAGRISAEVKSGVLTLHLPKVERAKPRRIEVRAV